MGIIVKSAYVEFDEPKRLRARIVFADGGKSGYFATQSRGQELLADAVAFDDVTGEEAQAVREQIMKSGLPPEDGQIDDLCDYLSEVERLADLVNQAAGSSAESSSGMGELEALMNLRRPGANPLYN